MLNWKQIFLKAAGFGAGFAAIVILAVGYGIWQRHRPVPALAWNKSAVTAKWIKAATVKQDGTVKLEYELTNATSEDYSLDGTADSSIE